MSRGFVKETDDGFEDLPDRPISEHPNDVTKEGLKQIEAEVAAAKEAYAAAQAANDRTAMASASRELRYWSARRR
jgi:transcription elongation GreA/GreB family factor